MILTIDLGAYKDDITINPGDTSGKLAKEFCIKHRLATDVQEALRKYLEDSIFTTHIQNPKRLTKTPDRILNQKSERIERGIRESPNEDLPKYISVTPDFTEKSTGKLHKSGKQFPGERLYYTAQETQIKKKEHILKMRTEREARENEEFNFSPRTNSKSPAYHSSRRELRLLETDKRSKAKLEYVKTKVFNDKYKECSFHPVINKKSEVLSKVSKLNKSVSKDKNIQLYESFKIQQERKETVSIQQY